MRGILLYPVKRNGTNPSQSQIAGSTTSRFDQCNAVKSSRLPRSRHKSVVRGNPFVSARNMTHPVATPRDVLFLPRSQRFLTAALPVYIAGYAKTAQTPHNYIPCPNSRCQFWLIFYVICDTIQSI